MPDGSGPKCEAAVGGGKGPGNGELGPGRGLDGPGGGTGLGTDERGPGRGAGGPGRGTGRGIADEPKPSKSPPQIGQALPAGGAGVLCPLIHFTVGTIWLPF
ncbi:MAG TPA: hypothetical protein VFA41_04760 [Ktedonobacteraceae bacterium]|nr:hypothetical protein [Ktedonobacteraceae bacterium]